MSEIKGQLLGIILTLLVFGAVSVVLARVYSNTSGKVIDYSDKVEYEAAGEIGYDEDDLHPSSVAGAGAATFPAIHY